MANWNGSILPGQSYNYTPFGETYNANDPGNNNEQGYTGHIEDETGLTYMQARYYDPLIGRFLQTGSIGYQDQLNLYAYVHNDSVNKVDPDGRQAMPSRFSPLHSLGRNVGNPNSKQSKIMSVTPILGDMQAIADAISNPSAANIAAAAVGIFPIVGDVAGKAAKTFDNLADGARLSTDDALSAAVDVLGYNPTEIADGVFRSGNGEFQVRLTDSDLGGVGTDGVPHMNFESGWTVTDAKGRETFVTNENKHIILFKVAIAGGLGATGAGIGRGVANLTRSVAGRTLANGGAGGVLGATNTVAFNAIDGKGLTENVGAGAALGAAGGALGSLAGDAVDGTRQAIAEASFDAMPTATKNLADGIGAATNSAGTSASSANAASLGEVIGNTASNSVGTVKSASDCASQDQSCN